MANIQDKVLKIALKISEISYTLGEPVVVSVTLTNLSREIIIINKRMGINPGDMVEGTWEIKFDISFPPGERNIIGTLINRGKPQRNDFTELSPGENINRDYILTNYYWIQLPGKYSVQTTYHNSSYGSMFDLQAWVGEITSNKVHFFVKANV